MGGFSQCCEERRWGELAEKLGYTSKAGAGSALRLHYERLIYPFDVVSSRGIKFHMKPLAHFTPEV